ncbi:D-alanyl-D-alanine carboxypeptidase family protein [Sporolactobacillus sp. Y61]|uniref:serine-type D-Ala-D-Ala carboxypeptidase n=1 Tax=Sporolactobacillus sp. Y61 TaxID=3160863 RepID=A0AAU8IDM8_9BACL
MNKTLFKAVVVLLCTAFCFTFFPGQARGAEPDVSAQSAVLMDQSTGRLLFNRNGEEKLPIASITKVMTAVLAIESGKMNQLVTVSSEAVKTEGSSLYLKSGEKISLRDLVYGLMLRSGNDASLAIAEAVGGSKQGFVLMMNEKAAELGMTDTHFMNPNGLEHPDHYSTAHDMAILTKYAMTDSAFRKITGTEIYRARATNKEEARSWLNKNKLLRQYKYTTGGKTGFTRAAGRTLISTASKKGMDLIVVTLNDGNDWRDHKNLYEWGFSEFTRTKLMDKGPVHAKVDPFYKGKLFVKSTIVLPLSVEEKRRIKKELILLRPPKRAKEWKPAQPAGRLLFKLNGRVVTSVPVYYKNQKKAKKKFWTLFGGFIEAAFTGRERPRR